MKIADVLRITENKTLKQLISNGAKSCLSFKQVTYGDNVERFNLLYDEFADKVLGFIVSFNYSKEEAEKILCKVFLTVWGNINAFDNKEEKKLHMLLVMATEHIYTDKKEFMFEKLKLLLTRI